MLGSAFASALLPDGKVLVLGAQGTNDAPRLAEIYDPNTGQWTVTSAPANAHPANALLLRNGKVLIAGGTDSSFHRVATAELYDPVTGNWSPTPATNTLLFARTLCV